jgi:acylphosphatase
MKLKVVIQGPKVHDVGYRNHLLSEADNLRLKGFSVRNLRENSHQVVEVLVEGDEGQVSSFRESASASWPKAAEVSSIAFEEYEGRVESITRFAMRFQSLQLSKGIESILRIEKIQGNMLEKQDRMLEPQTDTLDEVRGMRSDLRDYMDRRFARIESEIAEIKRAMRELGVG